MRVHNTYETLSSRRLGDPKPVTRLTKKIRKDDCSKRKKSFKEKVKKIDDLTTRIQEIAEEVKDFWS